MSGISRCHEHQKTNWDEIQAKTLPSNYTFVTCLLTVCSLPWTSLKQAVYRKRNKVKQEAIRKDQFMIIAQVCQELQHIIIRACDICTIEKVLTRYQNVHYGQTELSLNSDSCTNNNELVLALGHECVSIRPASNEVPPYSISPMSFVTSPHSIPYFPRIGVNFGP